MTSGILDAASFIELAQRCGLPLRAEDLGGLEGLGVLTPASWGGQAGFACVHLLPLARYMEAARRWVHPWGEARSGEDEAGWRRAASAVEAALRGEGGAALQAELDALGERDPLGPLAPMAALLRPEALEGLRGDALWIQLARRGAAELAAGGWTLAPRAEAAPEPEESPEPARGTIPLPSLQRAPSPRATTQQLPRVAPGAAPPVLPRPAPGAARPSAPVPVPDSRRQDEQATTSTPMMRAVRSAPPEPLPLPDAPPAPPADAAEVAAEVTRSAELARLDRAELARQIEELNRQRQRFMAEGAWDDLVRLYRDGLHLFPKAAERRQILVSIGALCEQKLHRPEEALEAFEQALALEPDPGVFEALARLYAQTRRADAWMACLNGLLERPEPLPWAPLIRAHLAEALVNELGQEDEALTLFQEILAGEADPDAREPVLEILFEQLDASSSRSARFLLAGSGLLEAYWAIGPRWQLVVDLYEQLFTSLASHDFNPEAAEALSRLAAICQANDDLNGAYGALVRSLTFAPTSRDTHRRLLGLARRLACLDALARVYAEEIERQPEDEARSLLAQAQAQVFEALDDREAQREALRLAAEADPSNAEVLHLLAHLDSASGKIEALDKLRPLLSGDARTEAALNVVRLRTEGLLDGATPKQRAAVDVDTALTSLQELLAQLPPEHPRAHEVLDLARTLLLTGQQPLALQLSDMLELHHRSQSDLAGLADTLEIMAQEAAGRPHDASRILGRLAAVHTERGLPEDAWDAWRRSLLLDPEQPEALAALEDAAARGDAWARFAAFLEDLLRLDPLPRREDWLRRLALLYADRLDDRPAAARTWTALQAILPGDPEAEAFLDAWAAEDSPEARLLRDLDARLASAADDAARQSARWEIATQALDALHAPRAAALALAPLINAEDRPGESVGRLAKHLGPARLDALEAVLEHLADLLDHPRALSDVLIRRAKLLANNPARREEAAALYERVLQEDALDPAAAAALLPRLADLYHLLGDPERHYLTLARQQDELAARKLKSPRLQEERAGLLERLASLAEQSVGRPLDALKHLQTWADLTPDDARPLNELLRLAEELEDHPAALDALKRLLQRPEPEQHLPALERLAQSARQRRAWDDLLDTLELQQQLQHDAWARALSLRQMAEIARRNLRDLPRAEALLERAREINPDDLESVHALADLLKSQERWEDAASLLRHTLDTNERLEIAEAMEMGRDLAQLLDQKLGEIRQAAGALELALALASGASGSSGVWASLRDRVRRELVDLYHRLDDPAAALSHLQEIERSQRVLSKDPAALARLAEEMGRAALHAHQLDLAERYLAQALEGPNPSAAARLDLAAVHLARERWTEALDLLTFLVQRLDMLPTDTERARVYVGLGQASAATGKVAKAVEMYRIALEHDPACQAAKDALG